MLMPRSPHDRPRPQMDSRAIETRNDRLGTAILVEESPGDQTQNQWLSWMAIAIIVAVGWSLLGWHLGERGLWSSHEGRAAQNAQDIIDEGHWLVPHLFTGDAELQKPPMYYWMVAVVGWLRGGDVDALAVRLPAAISAILTLLTVFWIGRRMWDIEAGLWSAAVLLATTRFAWLARVGRIDMPLCLVTTVSLALFWRMLTHRPRRAGQETRLSYFFYVLIAMGLLLKGPVVVILVGLPIYCFLVVAGFPLIPRWQKGWLKTWRRLRLVSGTCLTLLLAAPWYVAASVATDGEFFQSFFLYHNVERALGTDEALKAGPIWFYLPRLLVDTFPWSFLLAAIWTWLWRRYRGWRPQPAGEADSISGTGYNYLFLLCWGVSQFVFLSAVSFKRADYLLPALPSVALLTAGWLRERGWRPGREGLARLFRNPRRFERVVSFTAAALVSFTFVAVIWAGFAFYKNGLVESLLRFDLLASHLNETDRFMMRNVETLIRANTTLLAISGVVIVVCVWLVHTGWHQVRHRRLILGLGLPWLVAFLFQVHVILPALDPLREMSRFAYAIRSIAGPERMVYYFGTFDSDLAFHVGKPAHAVEDWEKLVGLGDSRDPCYVVIKASQLEWVRRDPRLAHWTVLVDNRDLAFGGHRDHRVLLTNQPYLANVRGNTARRR